MPVHERPDTTDTSCQRGRRAELWILLGGLTTLVSAWIIVVLFDALGLGTRIGITREAMTWLALFGPGGPVEWHQWVYMAAFIGVAGHIAGRLAHRAAGPNDEHLRRFCLLMLVGMAFMLIEDAGDVRHGINDLLGRWRGGDFRDYGLLFGLPQAFVIDAPYLIAMAAIPLYALGRHGRALWAAVPPARPYLVGGFGLYGLVGLGHIAGRLGDRGVEFDGLYPYLGALLSRWVFRDALEYSGHYTESMFYYDLIDGLVEESIELLAVTAMLGMLLVVARHTSLRTPSLAQDTPASGEPRLDTRPGMPAYGEAAEAGS